MNQIGKYLQTTAVVTSVLLTQTLSACGGAKTADTSSLPPLDDSNRSSYGSNVNSRTAAAPRSGMSNGQKVALLAGAAAVYYLFQKNQKARATGDTTEPQYYLSKNGRVYYREAGGRVHWVTAPQGGISVPLDEAQQYQEFEGYDGRTTGRNLAGIGTSN
ncbi:MAG: hypothetical protein Q8T09_05805 [Candidatus Melainabacteria bacterium]|nr:hypothetical protein [Candidatus Melainabacteria bacterium]